MARANGDSLQRQTNRSPAEMTFGNWPAFVGGGGPSSLGYVGGSEAGRRRLHEGRITLVDTSTELLGLNFELDLRSRDRVASLTASIGDRLTATEFPPSLERLIVGTYVVLHHQSRWCRGRVVHANFAHRLIQIFLFDDGYPLWITSTANLRIFSGPESEDLLSEPAISLYGILQSVRSPLNGWSPEALSFFDAHVCSSDALMEIVDWADSTPVLEFYRPDDAALTQPLSSRLIAQGFAVRSFSRALTQQPAHLHVPLVPSAPLTDFDDFARPAQSLGLWLAGKATAIRRRVAASMPALPRISLANVLPHGAMRWLRQRTRISLRANRTAAVEQQHSVFDSTHRRTMRSDRNGRLDALQRNTERTSSLLDKKECCICLEPYSTDRPKEALIGCGHCFCSVCIAGLKQRQPRTPTCPVCKSQFFGSMRIFD